MKKYVFLNVPLYGHINPTLAVVKELIAQGAAVIYYATEEFRFAIEATGAHFRPYRSTLRLSSVRFSMSKLALINECYFVIPQVLDELQAQEQYSFVYDSMSLCGKLLAQILKVPAIKLYVTFPTNEHFHPFDSYMPAKPWNENITDVPPETRSEIDKLCSTFQTSPFASVSSYYWHVEPLNIVFLPRAFHPAGATFDQRFLFVGPSIVSRTEQPDFPFEKLGTEPVLYISLGSLHSDLPPLYDICLSAFSNQPRRVVLSIGQKIDAEIFGPLAGNIIMRPSVPQLDVLQRTDVFITHGGTNSVMEALYYGVPMVVIPVTHEHSIVARRIEELQLGVALRGTRMVTAQLLRNALRRIATTSQLRANIHRVRGNLLESGGYQQAAESLMQFHQP